MPIGLSEVLNAWAEMFGLLGLLLWVLLITLVPIIIARRVVRPWVAYTCSLLVLGLSFQIPILWFVGFEDFGRFWAHIARRSPDIF